MKKNIWKRRAMSTERANEVRDSGHRDALEFAIAIGLDRDYKNDKIAKKDVIDKSGDAHSVKSGAKRWQLFLYGANRIDKDNAFQTMNGIGQILLECIRLFPKTFDDYEKDKLRYKKLLQQKMVELKDKFQTSTRVATFLEKAIFNGGEVSYLTVKHDNIFHVFYREDVIKTLLECLKVENSKARNKNQTPNLKVIFKDKIKDINVIDLEIRNSGENHYKEVLLVANKNPFLNILFGNIVNKKEFNEKVILYGKSISKFKNK